MAVLRSPSIPRTNTKRHWASSIWCAPGQYDMGHSASYYWKGKVPNTLYFTTMPFGMTAPEQYGWFYQGGGMELMNKVYDKYNLLSLPGR